MIPPKAEPYEKQRIVYHTTQRQVIVSSSFFTLPR